MSDESDPRKQMNEAREGMLDHLLEFLAIDNADRVLNPPKDLEARVRRLETHNGFLAAAVAALRITVKQQQEKLAELLQVDYNPKNPHDGEEEQLLKRDWSSSGRSNAGAAFLVLDPKLTICHFEVKAEKIEGLWLELSLADERRLAWRLEMRERARERDQARLRALALEREQAKP